MRRLRHRCNCKPPFRRYALYYLVNDDTHAPVSLVHWTLGLALAPVLIAHVVAGRRSRAFDHGFEARRGERK